MQSICSEIDNAFDLCNNKLLSANSCLECEEIICDAIGVFKFGLLGLRDSVNCDAIAGEELDFGKCDPVNLFFTYFSAF